MTGPLSDQQPRGVLKRLYHGETKADIVGRWKLWFGLSAVFLLVGGAGLATGGFKPGIDFTGGTVWQVEAGKADVAQVTEAMAGLGYEDVQVQELTQSGAAGGDARFLRVEAEATAKPAKATTTALAKATSGLGKLSGDVPDAAEGRIGAVRDNLEAVDGPFAVAVPEPLKGIQAEIDKLPRTLAATKGEAEKATAARQAAGRIQTDIDELDRLETQERTRVGQDVSDKLAELTGTPVSQVTVDTVGPSWGKQISDKAQTALVVFLIAITVFITIRFELKMAIATVVALFHDLLMVIGLYAVFRFPITPATVVALLTMLGFSIYDGIVVFDRVNENTKLLNAKSKMTYSQMANQSLNEVLMRSLNTSITSLMPILSVLIVGTFVLNIGTLEEFGLALFLGLLSGAYSSIFIATPLLAMLKEREPQYRDLRAQIAERGHGTVVSKAETRDLADQDPVKSAVMAGPSARPVGPPPRPRKQGKKR
ncbi:MAG: protein translocase subunit secF [Acidimicrobiales bacterium]|nr:protein translocase subunit secF [Acidimicrobiales bacterium]